MKIGFVDGTYTAITPAIADQECINWYIETNETPGAQVPRSLIRTPGLKTFVTMAEAPVRAQIESEGRYFAVGGQNLVEIDSAGTQTVLASIGTDGKIASIAASNLQLLIVSGGRAWCFTLATNAIVEVTALLAGTPIQVAYSDGYFIVGFQDSNKFQVSDIFDGTTWPGIQVSEVSVFPENISSIIVNQRQLYVFGARHMQVYQDTGSDNIFDPIPGAFMEQGCIATFAPCRLDNTVFWIGEDERGARMAWRANGYTPQRISTHAVETEWDNLASMDGVVSYSYQEVGHLFWVLYVPSAGITWVYDVAENLWAKRGSWSVATSSYSPHKSWNHCYVFGKHLVGDWSTGKIYEMSMNYYDDDGSVIRRLRRAPTVGNEMEWINHASLTLDFDTGQGPQPPLTDGSGNPRAPQCMLRFSDDRGRTWSNQRILDCGFAGQYQTRVIAWRLGRSRYRVYELSVTDAIPWVLVDAYLKVA